MKIFILLGNPDKDTTSGHFVDYYERGAREAGHEVRRTNIGEMKFDPILHFGYKVIQPFEPDILKVQEDIKWADHFVILYPVWWSTMPAILKGLFDRMWMPGFAFHFFPDGLRWHRLLKGKTARIFATSDSWPPISRIIFGDTTNELRKGILWFSGISASVQKIGPLKRISDVKKAKWNQKFYKWGKRGY